jgi:hypothetical protein
MNKKTGIIIGIVVVLLIILVAVFNSNQDSGSKPVVKIGVTLPLTGPVAML